MDCVDMVFYDPHGFLNFSLGELGELIPYRV